MAVAVGQVAARTRAPSPSSFGPTSEPAHPLIFFSSQFIDALFPQLLHLRVLDAVTKIDQKATRLASAPEWGCT